MNSRIFPSLIAAPLLKLASIIESLEPHVDGFHIDVMDDHFVHNLGFSPQFIQEIAQETSKPLWIHLMVAEPRAWITRASLFKKSDIISVHYETLPSKRSDQHTLIGQFKEITPHVGVALNNETDLSAILPFIPSLNHILLMSVKPGFSGQTFLETTIKKIDALLKLRTETKTAFRIGIDGGVNVSIFKEKLVGKVDDIALGTALFKDCNYSEHIKEWKKK